MSLRNFQEINATHRGIIVVNVSHKEEINAKGKLIHVFVV